MPIKQFHPITGSEPTRIAHAIESIASDLNSVASNLAIVAANAKTSGIVQPMMAAALKAILHLLTDREKIDH